MWLTVSNTYWATLRLEKEDLQITVKCIKTTSTQCLKHALSSRVLVGLISVNPNNPFVLYFSIFENPWKHSR